MKASLLEALPGFEPGGRKLGVTRKEREAAKKQAERLEKKKWRDAGLRKPLQYALTLLIRKSMKPLKRRVREHDGNGEFVGITEDEFRAIQRGLFWDAMERIDEDCALEFAAEIFAWIELDEAEDRNPFGFRACCVAAMQDMPSDAAMDPDWMREKLLKRFPKELTLAQAPSAYCQYLRDLLVALI